MAGIFSIPSKLSFALFRVCLISPLFANALESGRL